MMRWILYVLLYSASHVPRISIASFLLQTHADTLDPTRGPVSLRVWMRHDLDGHTLTRREFRDSRRAGRTL